MAKTKSLTELDGELWRLKPNPVQEDGRFKPWRIEIGGRASDGAGTDEGVSEHTDLGSSRATEYSPKERYDIIKGATTLNNIMSAAMKAIYLSAIDEDLT